MISSVTFLFCCFLFFFFFKQKTAYEMRISDWSSDVCSSDVSLFSSLRPLLLLGRPAATANVAASRFAMIFSRVVRAKALIPRLRESVAGSRSRSIATRRTDPALETRPSIDSEEHTSELQSLMRISYAVFCLKKKKQQ